MTEDLLKKYGFIHTKDGMGDPFWYLQIETGIELWFIKNKMCIAGYDCPNEGFAVPVRCNDEQDLKEIINILTRK